MLAEGFPELLLQVKLESQQNVLHIAVAKQNIDGEHRQPASDFTNPAMECLICTLRASSCKLHPGEDGEGV